MKEVEAGSGSPLEVSTGSDTPASGANTTAKSKKVITRISQHAGAIRKICALLSVGSPVMCRTKGWGEGRKNAFLTSLYSSSLAHTLLHSCVCVRACFLFLSCPPKYLSAQTAQTSIFDTFFTGDGQKKVPKIAADTADSTAPRKALSHKVAGGAAKGGAGKGAGKGAKDTASEGKASSQKDKASTAQVILYFTQFRARKNTSNKNTTSAAQKIA